MGKVEIEENIYKEIREYCKLNHLKINEFINSLVKKSFSVEKFGEKPPMFNIPAPVVEKEVEKPKEEEKPSEKEIEEKIVEVEEKVEVEPVVQNPVQEVEMEPRRFDVMGERRPQKRNLRKLS